MFGWDIHYVNIWRRKRFKTKNTHICCEETTKKGNLRPITWYQLDIDTDFDRLNSLPITNWHTNTQTTLWLDQLLLRIGQSKYKQFLFLSQEGNHANKCVSWAQRTACIMHQGHMQYWYFVFWCIYRIFYLVT